MIEHEKKVVYKDSHSLLGEILQKSCVFVNIPEECAFTITIVITIIINSD